MYPARLALTDKAIIALHLTLFGQQIIRDDELPGFFVMIGRRRKTFMVQGDLRENGKRRSVRIKVGEVGEIKMREARAKAKDLLGSIARGVDPRSKMQSGGTQGTEIKPASSGDPTLRAAWTRYRDSHLKRKGRSDGTIEAGSAAGDFLNAEKVEDAIGLCLSGGGFRAMIYHVGALRRLNELGLLSHLQEIASVSGGSITAGRLAYVWKTLEFDQSGCAANFEELVAAPLVSFASRRIDTKAILLGLLPGQTAADHVAGAYDRYLFHGASLQDIPDHPRFTFMSTNLQTGSGWRFAKAYAADYRVGRIDRPRLPLARVVAASSAFPPFLSPVEIKFGPGSVQPMAGADLHCPPFTDRAILTDGGVYDNLGLERIWRRCRTILVSNAGKATPEFGSPTGRWVGQIFRTLNLVQQQAENSRRRILFGMNNLGQRKVAY